MGIKTEQINQIDSDGFQQGLWRTLHDNSQLSFECTYVNGNLHGLWRYWLDNGALRWSEYYVNGILEGETIFHGY